MIAPTPPKSLNRNRKNVVTVKILGRRNGITKVKIGLITQRGEGYMYNAFALGMVGATIHVDPSDIWTNKNDAGYKLMDKQFFA